jgi:AraC family transcriptional activator of pobA
MVPETVSLHIETIAQMHQLLDVAKPRHPLFSILRFEDFPDIEIEQRTRLVTDFYQVTLKTGHPCKIQYGQNIFDFDEGIISCFAPKQVSFIDQDFRFATSGWQLSIHPDFLRLHPLGKKIKEYGFFEYTINEALILSDEEQQSIEAILLQTEKEYYLPIDRFSQDVIVSNIDLLLTYCNRYYNRQFITRKALSSELLIRFEEVLEKCMGNAAESGLPTVTGLAAQMNLSPKYLSDCLKQLTGKTTQQIVHDKIVEQAKGMLTTTGLTINEIAFGLGFEQSQSFSKLFKSKTSLTPLAFRQSFN